MLLGMHLNESSSNCSMAMNLPGDLTGELCTLHTSFGKVLQLLYALPKFTYTEAIRSAYRTDKQQAPRRRLRLPHERSLTPLGFKILPVKSWERHELIFDPKAAYKLLRKKVLAVKKMPLSNMSHTYARAPTIPASMKPTPVWREWASLLSAVSAAHAALPTVFVALSRAVYVFLSPHVA